jgi:hypothetical protein
MISWVKITPNYYLNHQIFLLNDTQTRKLLWKKKKVSGGFEKTLLLILHKHQYKQTTSKNKTKYIWQNKFKLIFKSSK